MLYNSATAMKQSGTQNPSFGQQTQTGWWSKLTGGDVEKKALVSQQHANRMFQMQEALKGRGFSSAEALKNREFQKMMSNTAYQRAMADMKKAGLNPALMFGSGSSASTPSGSTAQAGSTPSGSGAVNTPSSTGQLIAGIGILLGGITTAFKAGAKVANTAKTVSATKYVDKNRVLLKNIKNYGVKKQPYWSPKTIRSAFKDLY